MSEQKQGQWALDTPWKDCSFVAFDLETSGKYPLEAEVCEMAAVKWASGQIVDRWQTLIRPRKIMSDEVIAIHHITNEMVAEAPPIEDQLGGFLEFMADSVGIAHHAPFDMGFLMVDIERLGLPPPISPVLCTSLLSRRLIPESGNHRLGTLTRLLGLPEGQSHRALYDAETCLAVALECFTRLGEAASLDKIIQVQEVKLNWRDYSVQSLSGRPGFQHLISATQSGQKVDLTYAGGSRPGKSRRVLPIGLVRNPRGDFLVACEEGQQQSKRYLLDKIQAVSLSSSD